MGLTPNQFEELQPHEFQQLWDGYIWRKENNENMLAFFVCNLMNIEGKSLKQPITPSQILKPLRQPEIRKTKSKDEEYLRKQFNLPGGE